MKEITKKNSVLHKNGNVAMLLHDCYVKHANERAGNVLKQITCLYEGKEVDGIINTGKLPVLIKDGYSTHSGGCLNPCFSGLAL